MTGDEWAERYARAWEEGDEDAVAGLFTEDAEYRSAPFREPYRGEAEIRAYWRRGAAAQEDVRVRTGRPFVDGDRAVVEWWTTMTDPDDGEITLPGCLLLQFAPDGRCSALRETGTSSPAASSLTKAGASNRARARGARAGRPRR